uniref:Uncharacterized protein n=1 Tax=Triticum urartu TaxID=4572 RepID=A0A8R7UZ30_TRIUA
MSWMRHLVMMPTCLLMPRYRDPSTGIIMLLFTNSLKYLSPISNSPTPGSSWIKPSATHFHIKLSFSIR